MSPIEVINYFSVDSAIVVTSARVHADLFFPQNHLWFCDGEVNCSCHIPADANVPSWGNGTTVRFRLSGEDSQNVVKGLAIGNNVWH